MSILKSKFFLGVLVVATLLVGVVGVYGAEQAAAASCSITMTLKVGSRGAEVMCLQQSLGITQDGAFGPKTKAAVVAWQKSVGLVGDGVFGPMSRAAWVAQGSVSGNFPAGCQSASGFSITTGQRCDSNGNLPAGCTSTAGFSSTTGAKCDGSQGGNNGNGNGGALQGGAGDISSVTLLGTPSNEAVGENESNHKVLGFEVKADSGSDIALTSAKIEFEEGVGVDGGSTHLNDYIASVSVWQGSTKVGSANVDDFTKDATGVYSRNISLSNAVVRADQKSRFYVAVTAQNNVDSADMADAWGVFLNSVRFNDATGAILTDTEQQDSDNTTIDAGEIGQQFTIESASSASNAKLTITESSSNPNAGVVQVDDQTDVTDNVPLLKFTLKATGSDLWIDELPVLFTTSAADVKNITSSVNLTLGNQDFSESTSGCANASTCTIVFNDLNYTLHEGDSVNGTVSADINGVGSALNAGDTLRADITSTQRNAAVVELGNENGDDLGTSSTDRVGTASGEDQAFYNQGITVTPSSPMTMTSIPVDGAADTAQASITFKVTAIGEDVYLDKTTISSNSQSATPAGDNRARIETSAGVAVAGSFSASLASNDNNSDEMTNTFKIANGQTASFTLSMSAVGTSTQVRGVLYGLEWGTSDAATGSGVYTLDMGVNGSYKTPFLFVSGS